MCSWESGLAGTPTFEGWETTGPVRYVGGSACAVAVLVRMPVSTSAWTTVYVAVQVTWSPGASDAAPAGQLMADRVP